MFTLFQVECIGGTDCGLSHRPLSEDVCYAGVPCPKAEALALTMSNDDQRYVEPPRARCTTHFRDLSDYILIPPKSSYSCRFSSRKVARKLASFIRTGLLDAPPPTTPLLEVIPPAKFIRTFYYDT